MMDSLTLPELGPVFAESSSHHRDDLLPAPSSLQMMMIMSRERGMGGWVSYDTVQVSPSCQHTHSLTTPG